ncbi:hypothetical protein BDV30DRAFT_222258 [Aspergillus minisclerotigenes]|uniref:RBR-type E3 ubiquitin transferase n=1 Tax=Aspergillus minisclerotigenes TaxID=656917 RepID=A0A5N6JLI4_9EURO|nr:hypothetical protein BDV30DRAFT_222258 [Aspergillus minisclerotigenes]
MTKDFPAQIVRYQICAEEVSVLDITKLSCGDHYCRDCLKHFFELSIRGESHFPPRCCRQLIPLESVEVFLDTDAVERFEERRLEVEALDRTYCSLASCAMFIHPTCITDDRATCPTCQTVTCSICKCKYHNGDCPKDSSLQDFLSIAKTNGLQCCYLCGRMVELEAGCNHITCYCGAHFCYFCGQKWKTCPCNPWEEHGWLPPDY